MRAEDLRRGRGRDPGGDGPAGRPELSRSLSTYRSGVGTLAGDDDDRRTEQGDGGALRVQGRADPRGDDRRQDVRRQAGEGAERARAAGVAAQGDHLGRGQGPHRPRRGRGRAGHLRASRRVTSATAEAAEGWLAEHRDGVAAADALAFFDSLPTVALGEIIGRWRGSGLPTGSPMDGLLEAYGWYGKEFIGVESVHPLLFRTRAGRPRPVDPAFLPLSLLR